MTLGHLSLLNPDRDNFAKIPFSTLGQGEQPTRSCVSFQARLGLTGFDIAALIGGQHNVETFADCRHWPSYAADSGSGTSRDATALGSAGKYRLDRGPLPGRTASKPNPIKA